ncbi:cation:proton antiporter [Haliangium sp.]|uniref:cation:proton antiporter n=1 Tax=Haliangium sp. TaxID=2663208 RepID=UPI003D0BEA83
MHELFFLGTLITCGIAGGTLMQRLGLPRVTSYVIVGVAFSPGLLGGLLTDSLGVGPGRWTEELTSGALGIIAYLIGGSLSVSQIRRYGASLWLTVLGEGLFAAAATAAAMWLWLTAGEAAGTTLAGWQVALCIGAIATSTDPAASVAVIHQYRARGQFTSMLMAVVASDDLLGILVFSLLVTVGTGADLVAGLSHAGLEIVGSLALGVTIGAGLGLMARARAARELLGPLVVGVVLLALGLADALHLSPLLCAMTLGFMARVVHGASAEALFDPIERAEELLFVVFFTVAGLYFEVDVFAGGLGLIAVYVLARAFGKWTGATLGARIGGAPRQVYRWLGPTLVPQAGVAIGLALTLGREPGLRPYVPTIVNMLLGATLLHELAGPLLTRFALSRAGELSPPTVAPAPESSP